MSNAQKRINDLEYRTGHNNVWESCASESEKETAEECEETVLNLFREKL